MQEENNSQIIKTIGEHGEEIYMKLQEVVNVGGKDYALLSLVKEDVLPTDDNDDDEFNFVAQAISDSDEIEDED